jgi:hypothetical protein
MTDADADACSAIERRIRERTWGRMRHVHVELSGEQVVVHGQVPTYYLKQLALEAARESLGAATSLVIDIDVI